MLNILFVQVLLALLTKLKTMDSTFSVQCHAKKLTLPFLVSNALLSPHKCYHKTGRVFAKERVKTAKEDKPHILLPIIILPKTESPEGRKCESGSCFPH